MFFRDLLAQPHHLIEDRSDAFAVLVPPLRDRSPRFFASRGPCAPGTRQLGSVRSEPRKFTVIAPQICEYS